MSRDHGVRSLGESATLLAVTPPRGGTITERLQKLEPGVRPDADAVENALLLPLVPDDVIGHYRILGRLGIGGMGYIHRALDLQLEREVAIKVALESIASDHDAMLREARALAALNHPNVVTVHEVGIHEGCAYIVMELLRGEPLRARLDRERPSLVEALSWACDVLRGLSAAHSARIVHLDIKPENVFITKDGYLKLIDFGIARHKRTGAHEPGQIVGTVAYMAPEQLLGDPLDFRADIFAFGILLHELVTGRHPFMRANMGATMHALLAGDFFQDGAAADPDVEAIVRACMALEPSERPPSAAHVLQDLERVLRARAHVVTPAEPRSVPPRSGVDALAPTGPAPVDDAPPAIRDSPSRAPEPDPPMRADALPPKAAKEKGKRVLLAIAGLVVAASVGSFALVGGNEAPPRVLTRSLKGYVDSTLRQEPATGDVGSNGATTNSEPAPAAGATATPEPAPTGAKRSSPAPPRSAPAAKATASALAEPPRPAVDIRLNR
ncbi:serine/threonine-protein kinase [Polyangium aurulentum]|uniref:serine/threonine-protein kinase n=1 Tax=Polyangium aurulentum TaxID=2567896 RepID=UPI00146D7651|nr:serine/threonine-protein kinase [Polyangium aurulentum]UQA54926.1 protein kinase [Polyangium aurulentum]